MNSVGAEAIPQCREQQHLQPTAVHRILRIPVAPVDAARLPEQKRALGVVVRNGGGCHGDPGQLVAEPQLVELAHGVRQEVDADAQRAEVRAFDDGHVDATGMECECGGQAADARSGNENVFSHVSRVGACYA